MSAVNIFLFADRAIIWTDGAAYDGATVLEGWSNKVHLLPHLAAAVVCRGDTLAGPVMAKHAGLRFGSFDEAVAGFAEAAAAAFDEAAIVLDLDRRYEAFLVGRSESRGAFEAYALTNESGGLMKVGPVLLAPIDGVEERIAVELPGLDANQLSTAEAGVRILEIQRALQIDGRRAVGGFAQATIVSAGGFQTIVAKRWPDRLGERIGIAA